MNIVIFDLETTGLSPSTHEIIQIAGVRMRSGRILEEEVFTTFVKPRHTISEFIANYTGITDLHVQNAPTVDDALVNFSKFVGESTLIAHNGRRFDMPFIRESCTRHYLPVRPIRFVDSMSFSRKIWGGRAGHGLDAVMNRLNLSTHGAVRHTASGDVQILAEAVRLMWKRLCSNYKECPVALCKGVLPL